MISMDTLDSDEKSLGTLLREAREMRGYAQAELANETKISPKSLEAMESDDFLKLPSRTFTRGFYRLYAQAVGLDPVDILKRFDDQFGDSAHFSHGTLPPTLKAKKLENMAERPISGSMFSWVLAGLLILLLLGGLLSWYFSWNPATYLSEKLRGFDSGSSSELMFEGQVLHSADQNPTDQRATTTIWPRLSTPSFVQLAFAAKAGESDDLSHTASASGYSISALFHEKTDIKLSVDGSQPLPHTFVRGESAQWLAARRMVLTLPGDSDLSLTMNNRPVPFPSSEDGSVTIILPDDLL